MGCCRPSSSNGSTKPKPRASRKRGAVQAKLHCINPLERLYGEIKGRSEVVGIFPNEDAPCPLRDMNRAFPTQAPNEIRLSDFTYVSTLTGLVHVAFAIDAYARRFVRWQVR